MNDLKPCPFCGSKTLFPREVYLGKITGKRWYVWCKNCGASGGSSNTEGVFWMKEIKHYICEICGTEFNDSSKAEKCERGHISCKKIVNVTFNSVTVDASGYPLEITVEMSDGKLVMYKRKKRL